ncbi:MAG TPA: hypothetical protein VL402_00045 [Xanthobacteraceae bacterium]|nr:hypothetical protein [Xanthobacteraceae bacterium]
MKYVKIARFIGAACAALVVSQAATTQGAQADDFFKGKQVNVIIPSGVGGGYDLYARFLSRFMGKHIPGNPTFVVKNMPGAGGIVAANYLYSVAPKDGLTIAGLQNTITLNQLGKMSSVKFDVRKFDWIGNMSIASTTCSVSGAAENYAGKDFFTHEVTVGATSGSPTVIPLLLNSVAKTKFKVVQGYLSTSNVLVAMQGGEVNGLCGWSWDGARVMAKDLIAKGLMKVGLDIGIQYEPELHDMKVPFIMDLVKDEDAKSVLRVILATQVYNRPFAAPPGVPADRLAILQKAFKDTLDDPEVKTEAERTGVSLRYLAPQDFPKLLGMTLDVSPELQQRAVAELKKAGWSGF